MYVQCFEWTETRRLRNELGYQGKLIQLLGDKRGADGTDYDFLKTKPGLEELARVVDGIGPALSHVVTGKSKATMQFSDLVPKFKTEKRPRFQWHDFFVGYWACVGILRERHDE